MRVVTVACLSSLFYFYGFVFDLVVISLDEGIYCNLIDAASCALSREVDYWLSQFTFLFLIPGTSLFLINGFANRPRLIRATVVFGLLMVAS